MTPTKRIPDGRDGGRLLSSCLPKCQSRSRSRSRSNERPALVEQRRASNAPSILRARRAIHVERINVLSLQLNQMTTMVASVGNTEWACHLCRTLIADMATAAQELASTGALEEGQGLDDELGAVLCAVLMRSRSFIEAVAHRQQKLITPCDCETVMRLVLRLTSFVVAHPAASPMILCDVQNMVNTLVDIPVALSCNVCCCTQCRSQQAACHSAAVDEARCVLWTRNLRPINHRPDGVVLSLDIDRSCLLRSSFDALWRLDQSGELAVWGASLSASLIVNFVGKSGVGDGVVRDWVTHLLDAALDTRTGAFAPCADEHGRTVHVSGCAGRLGAGGWVAWVAGCALGFAQRLGLKSGYHLSRALVRTLQGHVSLVHMEELEQVQPQVFASCRAVQSACTQREISALGLPGFTYGDASLVPGGDSVPVTEHNRGLFTTLLCRAAAGLNIAHFRFVGQLRRGLLVVLAGADNDHALMMFHMLRSMSPAGINALLGGKLALPASDILSNTTVERDKTVPRGVCDAVMSEFCDLVSSMDDNGRRRLLRFWTGGCSTACTLQVTVVTDSLPVGRMPEARTCFRQLRLPATHHPGDVTRRMNVVLSHYTAYQDVQDEENAQERDDAFEVEELDDSGSSEGGGDTDDEDEDKDMGGFLSWLHQM